MAGTITALVTQEHNKERVNVYLDGEFAFGLALIEAAKLHKGQKLSDADIAALRAGDDFQQTYDRAVRFLGQRPRSIAEVRRSLSQRQVEAKVVDQVIARLESQGYLDDVAFARYWIGNRQQFRPRSARALHFELREKGVPEAIIGETLSGFDKSEAAYRAALDRARRLRGLEKREFREKLGAFLARRGFDYETVREVTDRLFAESQENAEEEAEQDAHHVPPPPTPDDIEES